MKARCATGWRGWRMALDLLEALSLPAGALNEDAFGHGGDAAVVIDGATNLGDALMPGGMGTGLRLSRSTNTCTKCPVAAGASEPARNNPIS